MQAPFHSTKMPNYKRKILPQAPFEGLQHESNNHTGKTSTSKRQRFEAPNGPIVYSVAVDVDDHLGRSIRRMMMRSKATLPIDVDDGAYEHGGMLQKSPKELHQELSRHIEYVKEGLKKSEDESDIDEHIIDELSRMVYGSNMIEHVGGGLDITLKLCKKVFRGGKEPPEEISENDPEYEQLDLYLYNKDLPCKHADILQAYREIVQHAKAARYMIEQVCINGKDLSEHIITQAHSDLTYKIEISKHIPWNEYSGQYRLWNVQCGSHVFMDHSKVRIAMRDMIEELESDIKKATEKGQIDPVALASKYCHKFVNIHPFGDGNGRMCRLILNTLLIKHSYPIVSIGQDGGDRQEYLRIAVAQSMKQLAFFTLRRACDSMLRLKEAKLRVSILNYDKTQVNLT